MSDTSDTSDIDNKKNQYTSIKTLNIGKFFITFILILFIIICYFSLGGVALFFAKLAQSNILPTEIKCFPYTENKVALTEIPTNIFTTFTSPPLSMKLTFPYDNYNSENSLLALLRDMKSSPNTSVLANYFIGILESMIKGNYAFLNIAFHSFNSLPEILVMLFGPPMIFLIGVLLFLWNNIYLIYLWFANMKWFFQKNTQELTDTKPKWELISPLNVGHAIMAIALVFLFSILFWFMLLGLPILPFLTVSICIITMCTYKGKMNDTNIYIGNIIKDVFKFHKTLIMGIFSFFLVFDAFINLGNIYGFVALVVLAILYGGIISNDLYKNDIQNGLSPFSSIKQAVKKCNIPSTQEKKHGFLYYLFKGGGKEKELLRELRKLQ